MRPTLGLLLDNLFDAYQEQLFQAVQGAAAARDANLFCYVGGAFAPRAGGAGTAGKNLHYDLLPRSGMDGLLLLNGALGFHVGDAELAERIAGLPPLPRVGVSRPVPGLPTLVLDNRAGVREVVRHLLDVHGCRRVAFVGGPPGSEADARLQGYRDALAERGIAPDPALEVPGDFSREAGTQAIRALLDERRARLDGLVAANDYMALYAMRALQDRGLRVPEDVRVAGFDDIPDAAGASPALTTVAQPLQEMGTRAVDLLLRQLGGELLPEAIPLASRPALRGSCGCGGATAGAPADAHRADAALMRAHEEFKGVQRVLFPTDVTEEEVRKVLVTQLPNLGVRSFYLSRYLGADRARARLVAHYGPADRVRLDAAPGDFEAARLVPGTFSPDHRHAYAVLPVYSREEQLGFALVELAELSGAVYEALMNQISTAVRVSMLLEEVRGQAVVLERKVEERTRELAGAQRQLLEAARQAGMAEIAVGALHGIGNLLTSVNVSAGEIAARAGRAEVDGVRRTAALLEAHRGDLPAFFAGDPRAALIPEYLGKLAARLGAEQDGILGEAAGLQDQLARVRETILALQSYAREGDELLPRERIDLAEVVETALRVQAGDLQRHGVRVQRALAPLPALPLQRSKILHVVVHVVKNAAEAMRAVPEERRRLTVTGRVAEDGAVVLAFLDQGEGIAPDDLPRVFGYGFSTKPDGNGFGLHSSANMMRQLGGEIAVESEGVGLGARVTLRFPPG